MAKIKAQLPIDIISLLLEFAALQEREEAAAASTDSEAHDAATAHSTSGKTGRKEESTTNER